MKLLHLVRWLDPSMPPHFLGRRVTADDLPVLAALAGDAAHPDHRTACLLGRELWEQSLLRVLAGFEQGHDLAGIDDQWRVHVRAWNDLARWLREHEATPAGLAARLPAAGGSGDGVPVASGAPVAGGVAVAGGIPADDPPVVLLTLLALAARPAETRRALADAASRARASVRGEVPWFAWMADGAGDDPLRLLAVARAAPEAALEGEARARELHAAEQRSAALRAQRAERERLRLAGRGSAVARAAAWSVPFLALWLAGSWVVGAVFGEKESGTSSVGAPSGGSGLGFGALAAVAVLVWAVQCGAEVLLARTQGTDYLPYGPWSWLSKLLGAGGRGLSKAGRAVSGAARQTRGRGCGLMLIAAIVPLLGFLLLSMLMSSIAGVLWVLVMVAGAGAHAVAAGFRLHEWRQAREEEERRAAA
ncbi:hypothetical protein [Actinomadura sp. J1-007]|uniref:hypothetical protein n=1 Tax=Actinomadura sp. J1-007 TaxID=2661913 RepID=UPI001F4FA0BC|nr:hypothetical protein [Actinomadura sp. J1-007]